jgi:hypothetical protein
MTNPENVSFSKMDPVTGTVVEFKGTGGAKVAYDAPHADMNSAQGHDKPHVGWQSAGKRGCGCQRGNITYEGCNILIGQTRNFDGASDNGKTRC